MEVLLHISKYAFTHLENIFLALTCTSNKPVVIDNAVNIFIENYKKIYINTLFICTFQKLQSRDC